MNRTCQTKLRPIAPLCVGDVVDYVPRITMQESAKCWLLGHCVGRSDAHVGDVLRRAKVDEYCPHIREFRPLPRKSLSQKQRASGVVVKRPMLVPLLPRYRLLHIDPSRRDLENILSMARISGLVCRGGGLIEVPQAFIDHVRRLEVEGALPGTLSARAIFAPGEVVRLAGTGPFAGFNAVVEQGLDIPIEELDPDTRIKVAISLIGHLSAFELSVSEIEKL